MVRWSNSIDTSKKIILANADVYFDKTLELLLNYNFDNKMMTGNLEVFTREVGHGATRAAIALGKLFHGDLWESCVKYDHEDPPSSANWYAELENKYRRPAVPAAGREANVPDVIPPPPPPLPPSPFTLQYPVCAIENVTVMTLTLVTVVVLGTTSKLEPS